MATALQDLIAKLQNIKYYQEMFTFVYGDATVTQTRIQNALAQFIRSIQSFDSKYDAGRAASANDQQPFANFTAQENQGKIYFWLLLFLMQQETVPVAD
jgi:cytochrome c peroxidase